VLVVLREKYYLLIADGWFVLREKYCWLVADKPNEQGANLKKPIQLTGPVGRFLGAVISSGFLTWMYRSFRPNCCELLCGQKQDKKKIGRFEPLYWKLFPPTI
jgi:hypothetical protein